MINHDYPIGHLVMINSLPWKPWPIEIDGLPNLKMVDLSMAMFNNQRVYDWDIMIIPLALHDYTIGIFKHHDM